MSAALALLFLQATTPPETPPADVAKNVIFAEVLGNGLLYSVNYERIVPAWHVSLRLGACVFTYAISSYGRAGNLTIFSIPLLANYYFRWGAHALELGLGATFLDTRVATDSEGISYGGQRAGATLAPTALVGYRYLPPRGGITFGAGFTPLMRASKFLPWGGATVGYAF